jgi:hypothetical protein
MKIKDKRAIEMGFNWIFAIIAGGFILFLAIYTATNFIGMGQNTINTETAAKIVAVFDPLETGLASGKSSEISLAKKSKIYFQCDDLTNPPFGQQIIAFSEQTFGTRYGEKNKGVPIKDKYVFVESVLEGKKIYLFTKPFFMSFKVADSVIMGIDDYCFYDTPAEIQDEIEGLNLNNIHFPNSTEKCDGKKVCFDKTIGCDIKVSLKEGSVQKESKKIYFVNNLVYGAIFASPEIYECNVKRLMNKFNELGNIYLDKISIIERKQCEPKIQEKLNFLMIGAKNLKSSKELLKLYENALEIDQINEEAKPGCKLY